MRTMIVLVFLALGCTTVLYDGPRRPRSEAVTLAMNGTGLLVLDGKRVSDGLPEGRDDEVEVLPGRHKLGVALFRSERLKLGNMTKMYYTQPVTICLDAQPGRRYLILPTKVQNGWMPVIRNEGSNQLVDNRCP